MENDVLYNRIMNVVHQEYGSGSTAVANPDGEATDSLEKIQIGDDIYSISGGALIVESESDDQTGMITLHCSFNDSKNAFFSGKSIVIHDLTHDVFLSFQPLFIWENDSAFSFMFNLGPDNNIQVDGVDKEADLVIEIEIS